MARKARAAADDKMIHALACGATVEATARQAQVSEATVYRRLKEAEFRKRLAQARADMVNRTAGTLTAAAMESIRTLLDLQKASAPPSIRLGAARAILEWGMKVRGETGADEHFEAMQERLRTLFDQNREPSGPKPNHWSMIDEVNGPGTDE